MLQRTVFTMESIVTAAEVLGSAYRHPIAILVIFYKN